MALFESKNFKLGEKFYQFKRQILAANDSEFAMLRVLDVSALLQCRVLEAKHQLLEMINALVSHEMRNPINAILS